MPLAASQGPFMGVPTRCRTLRKEWRRLVEVEQHAEEEAGVGVRRACTIQCMCDDVIRRDDAQGDEHYYKDGMHGFGPRFDAW